MSIGKIKFFLFIVTAFSFSLFSVEGAQAEKLASTLKCVERFEKPLDGFQYLPSGRIDPNPDVLPLLYLPRDACGFVDWAKAMKNGMLAPRDSIMEKTLPRSNVGLTGDILIESKMPFMADVIFPHEPHTVLLECKTCHAGLFEAKAGANPITMVKIWEGEYCGRCHGKVAFPLSSCYRCHNNVREVTSSE